MRPIASALGATLVLALVAVLVAPGRSVLVLQVAVLVLALCAGWAGLVVVREQFPATAPSPFEGAATPGRLPARPVELDRIELELRLSRASGSTADRSLVPRLRAVASARLTRLGLDLAAPPDRAACEARCGAVLWALVRPDRPVSYDLTMPGVAPGAVAEAIDALEAL